MKIAQINVSHQHLAFERRVVQADKFFYPNEIKGQNKIKPMPILRPSLPNSQHLIPKLRKQGHKYFSKFQASGPQTLPILQSLQIQSYSKFIHKFEFDPYLCDLSYLKPLSKSYKKLRSTKKLNLVIRRLDEHNELNRLVPFLSKFSRLQDLRFEMPNAWNFDVKCLAKMYKDLGKCLSLQNIALILANISFAMSPKIGMKIDDQFRRLIHLRKRHLHISLKPGTVKNYMEFKYIHKPWRCKLKELNMSYSLGRGWSMVGEERSIELEKFLAQITPHASLEKMRMQIIRITMTSEEIMQLVGAFGQLPKLRFLNFEFLNCKFDDLEAISVIYQISKIPHLEDLTIKIIQTPNISIHCIRAFVDTVLKMKNLRSFNLYFRKLALSSDEEEMLIMQLSNQTRIKFMKFKGSLHISQNQ